MAVARSLVAFTTVLCDISCCTRATVSSVAPVIRSMMLFRSSIAQCTSALGRFSSTLAGVISAGARRTVVRLRVRFGETDAMGVANNAAYLAWFEVGRVEYLRELGHSYADVHAGGMDMVVVEAHAEYLRALRFDDEFTVECACTAVRGASFTFGYELVCDGRARVPRLHPPCLRRPRVDAPRPRAGLARRGGQRGIDHVTPPSADRRSVRPVAA